MGFADRLLNLGRGWLLAHLRHARRAALRGEAAPAPASSPGEAPRAEVAPAPGAPRSAGHIEAAGGSAEPTAAEREPAPSAPGTERAVYEEDGVRVTKTL